MSLLSGLKNLIRSPVAKTVAGIVGGIPGAILSGASTAYDIYQGLKTPAAGAVMPGAGSVIALPTGTNTTLSAGLTSGAIRAARPILTRAGGAVVAAAKAVPRAAANLCRKYPTWCSSIGGTVAVEALMHNGQLPMPKRRRAKGISGSELKAFRRVARFTSKYCAPVHRAMRAPVMKRKGASCR